MRSVAVTVNHCLHKKPGIGSAQMNKTCNLGLQRERAAAEEAAKKQAEEEAAEEAARQQRKKIKHQSPAGVLVYWPSPSIFAPRYINFTN